MSICLSCSVSFRFFLFIDGGCIGTNLQLWVLCLPRGKEGIEGGSGDRNLTHCWPHDKRWLVNKSKAKANVSSLSLCVRAVCPAVPLARYRMSESFCLQLATAFGRASVGAWVLLAKWHAT